MAIYKSTSIYSNTPQTDWYLDFWKGKFLSNDGNDKPYVIPNDFDMRPDLAAFNLYGSEKYWYVFALKNKDILKDPIFDFRAGVEIFIPSLNAIKGIL